MTLPFQLRDPHGAARSVAYLSLAAGVYNMATGVVMRIGEPLTELITLGVVSVFFLIIGVACLRRPDRLPRAFWLMVPFVSIAMIAGLNYHTQDTTTGPQLFYLWPLLYAASYLSRALIVLTVVLISAGQSFTAFTYMTFWHALNDWIAITLAMAMTGLVVRTLNERNDKLRDVLEVQATSDSLTGAANRRAFDDRLAAATADATQGGDPVSLIMVDVDHFKTINDTWGHATGDRALLVVADALRSAGAGGHLVARLGGDEFAVLLRAGPYQAIRFAEHARTLVEASTGLPGGPPSLSIGVAVLPDHALCADTLQRAADAALYQAKEAGRGRSMLAGSLPTLRDTPAMN
jgi:diguanylate cyclase (GGDEF)-like protein